MIVKCPECELPVSNKAISCPHCGYPFRAEPRRPRKRSRMRLPNGFGQISEIKYKPLRKPFRAMVTVGKNEKGRPICKVLSYHKTYNEAYAALAEYNRNPYELNDVISMEELYNRWSVSYFQKLTGESSIRNLRSAWAKCDPIKNIKVREFRPKHIKMLMETIEQPNSKFRVKTLFNLMLDYAVEYELVDRNYARTFSSKMPETVSGHIIFTNEEISKLWDNKDNPVVKLILIQCYTGFRPQELCILKAENINADYIIGGMKTEAGKNRTVPIHEKIKGLVAEALPVNITYRQYYERFKRTISDLELNPEHRPHDPRKHFISMAKKYKVDEYAIKYIVGHIITDITEKTYTERPLEWLIEEINKIE